MEANRIQRSTNSYDRYRLTPKIKDGDRYRNYLRKTLDTTPHDTDFYHMTTAFDRIDLLAYKYYARADLWWVIADYNDLRFPLVLESGISLRLPSYGRLFMTLLEG
jgi:hypothetical protein